MLHFLEMEFSVAIELLSGNKRLSSGDEVLRTAVYTTLDLQAAKNMRIPF